MNEPFVRAIKRSGFSVEEISGLTGIAEIFIYKIAREIDEPGKVAAHSLATILEEPVEKLFPDYDEN